MRTFLLLIASCLTLGAVDSTEKVHQLREFNLGRYLTGPRISEGAMKGKATAIVCMGTLSSNPHSWAAAWTPEFEDLHKSSGAKVTVIGAAWGKGLAPKDYAEYAKKFKLEFTLVNGIEHAPFEVPRDGHCLIFNADGKLIYSGQPNKGNQDFKDAIAAISK